MATISSEKRLMHFGFPSNQVGLVFVGFKRSQPHGMSQSRTFDLLSGQLGRIRRNWNRRKQVEVTGCCICVLSTKR